MNKSTLAGAAMIAVAALTAPAMVAWSQSPPPRPAGAEPSGAHGPAGPGHEKMHRGWERWAREVSPQQACVDRIARRAGFVAAMGVKLGLTPDQKPLWDKVVAAGQSAQDSERKLCNALPSAAGAGDKLTVIDRMNHRQQMLQARLQALQQTEPAVQALYQALTAEQKAMLDHPFRRG
ncbi:MAG TPA: Spy/CpxP family protein refolding chaperone [Stellaceae bacterium]|nr:Spy/CpxP family protein refolding chaperone [Stellaceae bacterium]